MNPEDDWSRSPRPAAATGCRANTTTCPRQGLSRRAFASLAAGGIVGTHAGCIQYSGSTIEDLEGTTLRVHLRSQSPPTLQLNRFAHPGLGPPLVRFFQQLVLPVDAPTGEFHTSGHAWTVDGTEVSVPCLVADFELSPPEYVELGLDDRLTYWDGTAIDAEALRLHERLEWLGNGGQFEDGSFPGERRGEFAYRRTLDAESAPNRNVARRDVHPPHGAPVHPSFTRPRVEALADAASASALDEAWTREVIERVDVETYAEEGYGSGAYALETPEDVRNDAVILRRREDHPGDATADNLVVRAVSGQTAGANPYASVAHSGNVDAGTGVIHEQSTVFRPQQMPDRVEQLATYPVPGGFSMLLVFNWASDHLRRLWVRRAIAAAAPLDEFVHTGLGPQAAVPTHQSGMLASADERSLGRSFCEGLYDYPVAADRETAAEWLEVAGYTRTGGGWVGPDGEALTVSVQLATGFLADATRVLRESLEAFGVGVEAETHDIEEFQSVVATGDYDLTVAGTATGWSPASYYADWVNVAQGLTLSPLAVVDRGLDRSTTQPGLVPDRVSVPGEPGALRIDDVAYGGGTTGVRDDGDGLDVDLAGRMDELWAPETDAATFREAARLCARWFNYALPTVVLAQPTTGPWADVRNFSVPVEDSGALRTHPWEHPYPIHYHAQAGTIRPRNA